MSKFLAGLVTGILLATAFFIIKQRSGQIASTASTEVLAETTPMDESTETEVGRLPHDFVIFYDRFHSDSMYQLEHILFPLEGLPPDVDSVLANSGNFRWERENWILHKHFDDMEGNFTQQLLPIGNDMVIEQIRHTQAAYGMQRRFAKLGDSWQLIYYGAMNRLAE